MPRCVFPSVSHLTLGNGLLRGRLSAALNTCSDVRIIFPYASWHVTCRLASLHALPRPLHRSELVISNDTRVPVSSPPQGIYQHILSFRRSLGYHLARSYLPAVQPRPPESPVPNSLSTVQFRQCAQRHLHKVQLPLLAECICSHVFTAAPRQQHQQQAPPSVRCVRSSPAPQYQIQARRLYSTQLTDFSSLGVVPELQARLEAQGLHTALPVQTAAVPLILSGRNTAIKSCTGSGKTLAYLLPVLQLALQQRKAMETAVMERKTAEATAAVVTSTAVGVVDDSVGGFGAGDGVSTGSSNSTSSFPQSQSASALKRLARAPQAVIVAPSRELCIQIQRTAQDLIPGPPASRHLVQQLVGGANPRRQEAALWGGDDGIWPLVVVGTPGRVADLVNRGSLHVWGSTLLVLDEVDQLFGQPELRQHIDALCVHVGRRAQRLVPPPAHPTCESVSDDMVARAVDADLRMPSAEPGLSAAAAAAGIDRGRQTIIVSASMDARDSRRYASWCPDPAFVVLASLEALPPTLIMQGLRPSAEPVRPQVGAGPEDQHPAVRNGIATAPQQQLADQQKLQAWADAAITNAELTPPSSSAKTSSSGSRSSDNSSGSRPMRHAAVVSAATSDAAAPLSGVLPPQLAHLYVLTHSRHRTDQVRRLIHALQAERVLLFVPRQNQTMVTKYRLEARRMEVSILHGKLSKLERGNIMEAFRQGVFRALVVTDLGARGLDLPDCDAVMNFGPPADALSYAHRAGRTGRVGAPGVVVSVVTRLELPSLRRIAERLGVQLQAASVAHGVIAPGEEPQGDEQTCGESE